jgi:predicted transposase/invertase (TIGR01784 family)
MASAYDSVIKESFAIIIPAFCRRALGFEILSSQELSPELRTTLKRRLDYLSRVKLRLANGAVKNCLLHIEFQSRNDGNMVVRMLEYFTLLYRKYKMEVLQYVVYIGSEKARMLTNILFDNIDYKYGLLDLRNYPSIDFLESQSLEENLLAILGDYGELGAERVIEEILGKILSHPHTSSFEAQKYITHLEILSNLRKLQYLVAARISSMSIHYDIQKDLRYIQGKQEGIAIGKQEGIQEGIAIGKQEGIQEGIAIGKQEGIAIGRQEGVWEEKLNMAKQAIEEGLELSLIMRLTGLSETEIEGLAKI